MPSLPCCVRSLINLLFLLPALAQAQQTYPWLNCKPESIPATTPTQRFIDHDNGTVTDTQTGLMWKKCSEGQSGSDCSGGNPAPYTWQAALEQAQTANAAGGFAGHGDWRLPNIKELLSIVERQCVHPSINLVVFPQTTSGMFWSSSPSAVYVSGAWGVTFHIGRDSISFKTDFARVRLVRDGQ